MEAVATPYRPSKGRLALMVVLAVVAILAFLVLADVRLNPGDVVLEGVSDAQSRSTMTTILLVIEAVAFLAVLLLLLIRPAPVAAYEEPWTSTGGAAVGDAIIQIGCPGCGTVFEKGYTDVDEPHEQNFRCPNCGRAGRLKMELHKQVPMHKTVCPACSNEFISYRAGAECPRCHTPS
jgi:hypothetical protein